MRCDIFVELKVNDVVMQTRSWQNVDVMKTSPQKGWTRRKFNYILKDMNSCFIGKDKIVTAFFECCHRSQNGTRITGFLSGVNGKVWRQDGIFDR